MKNRWKNKKRGEIKGWTEKENYEKKRKEKNWKKEGERERERVRIKDN